jgi:predicted DCC family thiol-disulfide oxidoreductase YuxK
MTSNNTEMTVYFDGACPLCRAEIGYYKNQNGAECIEFLDVSASDGALPDGLTRAQAMARFHVRSADGELLSGAAAFVHIWRTLPGWRWAARIASLPGAMTMMEFGYVAFLRVRPLISKFFSRLQK